MRWSWNVTRWMVAMVLAAGGCAPVGEGELDVTDDIADEVDLTPKEAGGPGTACRCDGDCAAVDGHEGICVNGVCMTRAAGRCASGGSRAECPAGSRCWGLTGAEGSICWPDSAAYPGCVGATDGDGSCVFTTETTAFCDAGCASYCPERARPAGGAVGAACAADADCAGGTCYRAAGTGWADGYCLDFGCATPAAPCGAGGICVERLSTNGDNICMQPCGGSAGCREGFACRTVNGQDICWPGDRCSPEHPSGTCPSGQSCVVGACVEECSAASPGGWCPAGLTCAEGACAAADGCGSWECTGEGCDDIVAVAGSSDPASAQARADGYYLAHGAAYSYLRRDLATLVRWAACRMRERFPGVAPLALLDMTTEGGTTPGCPDDCRHPSGTHEGSDLDTAYFQTDGDNNGQCICGDGAAPCWNGYADAASDGYRCTTQTNIMSLEQEVWFLAFMARSPSWRIVGVDDTVCDDIRAQADGMLARGEIDATIHGRITTLGCYSNHSSWAFHHHHTHFSFTN